MTQVNSLKKLPYGKVNFSAIRQGNCAYIDKTRYIELLERDGIKYPFIVRPRRFGKTLFTSILEAYYDEFMAKNFEKDFAGTYIGEHKTPLASRFRIIHFDFSGIPLSEHADREFMQKVRDSIQEYFDKYPHPRQDEILQKDFIDASALAEAFFALLGEEYKKKIYVIIDEYEQFTTEIFLNDRKERTDIKASVGFYKDFFATLKKATYGAH